MPLESPYDGGRTAVANPDNALASPFGWHDTNGAAGAEFTTTQGNNVHAYTDVDANNSPDTGSSPSGGTSLTFNFPLDLAQAPSTYRPAAVTNLFYWSNVIHDVMYQYGFTEAAGNFQVNNYGRGGSGNDAVRAEAQDGGGTNNANFATPVDGSAPRMQMYIGTNPNPDVDGSFDNGVVVHEYGHGISNRLTGGRTTTSCLGNAEQMGEGWSDWYGLMFTMASGDTGPQSRGIGNYLFGYGATGGGIRPAPYSTNFSVNNYTYQRTRSGLAVPHGIGFVWATILWEATWELINVHGVSPDLYDASGTAGNQIMMRLVTEGLKLQPCQPGFVTGRDAILAADAALYGGAHTALLQAAFARRGLGYSASQGSSGSNGDNTEAFDLWPTGGNQAPNAAFSASCTGLTCAFTDASTDPDGTVASRAWTFGDGGSSTATSPSRTYAAAGTYTVTLTVTDDDGATDAASQTVTVTDSSGPAPLVLSVARRLSGQWTWADLTWTGFDGGTVRVFRNGALLATTTDDGAYSYRVGRRATGTDTWRVCDVQDGACSNDATVTYASGFADGVAAETALRGAFPNPFTATTDVRFSLADAGDVEVAVFNSLGQQVATLAAGLHEAGAHSVAFGAADLPTGVYVIRFRAGDTVQTARVMSVR
jgi:PKD repeat protein